MKIKLRAKNEKETMDIGESLGSAFNAPLVVSLVGELGAGKTTLTKGIAQGLKIKDNITSPTFTIMNEYTSGSSPLYHFDMYRLTSLDEALELGFGEYFDLTKLKGVSVVEWAENTEGILPARHLRVEIKKTPDDQREIYIEPKGIV